MDRRFTHEVRVRWRDTDTASEVFYPNYFAFVTDAETEFFRSRGLPQQELIRRCGIYLPRVTVHASFRARTHWDDLLQVAIWVEELAEKRYKLGFEITRQATGELVSDGYIVNVCVDAEKRKSRPIPAEIRDILQPLCRPHAVRAS
ncbi:MAG: acyl-CoA thioesterase [Candidatus Tectomicrobia bacterium]|nr:acyl-CoA thioesterase [Candidatus Tectomicrobia bacterium]